MMQIQPITEQAYVQATMTMDAMRMEVLLYRAEITKLKAELQKQNIEIAALRVDKENAIKSTDS